MSVLDEVLAANKSYVESFGDKGELALPPARQFAILTCMDARLDPAKYAGLSEGDAHVIRNAGGRASDDAIRSLVISYKLLGTKEWFVIHHSDCGMEFFTDESIRGLLSKSLETASLGPDGFFDVGKGPVPTKARLSTGSRSQTRSAPSLRTSSAFVVTPWFRAVLRSTDTSTTFEVARSWRCARRRKPARRNNSYYRARCGLASIGELRRWI